MFSILKNLIKDAKKDFVSFMIATLIVIVIIVVGIFIFMLLWNWLMFGLFGLFKINFWQTLGIFVLFSSIGRLLFKK